MKEEPEKIYVTAQKDNKGSSIQVLGSGFKKEGKEREMSKWIPELKNPKSTAQTTPTEISKLTNTRKNSSTS